MFIQPMLARPLNEKYVFVPGKTAAEEKIDGIRIICEISNGANDLFTEKKVTPWSRYGRVHPLPTHIMEDLAKFPNCILDGEIYVTGMRSYGATELVNLPDLQYSVFDILMLGESGCCHLPYLERQKTLLEFSNMGLMSESVKKTPSRIMNSWEDVEILREEVWDRDGEGLILKNINAQYQPNKRSKDFIKIKKLQSAKLRVLGFMPSRGLVNDRGLCAMIVIQDEEGNITTVKTRNDAECRRLESLLQKDLGWREVSAMSKVLRLITNHSDVGRYLWIEFQERTPDGNYRHPRADHWDGE